MDTTSKLAVVTGAGSGIGKCVALGLCKNGWSVALAGRRREPLEATARETGVNGARTLVVPTDVADPAAVGHLFAEARAQFGRIDLLFNNAGIFGPTVPFEEISYEAWKAVININVTGMFLCAREAYRMMKDQVPMGGRIINNGSVSAHVPRPNAAAYTTAKHAVTGLTRSLSLDGRPYDIVCSQIDIGNAATEMVANLLVDGAGARQADGSIAPEPTMDLDHVARAVVHMAGLPLSANVQFMTLMATKMPYIGRG